MMMNKRIICPHKLTPVVKDFSDRGSGTVLAVGIICILLMVFTGVAGIASVYHSKYQAMRAADISALAAADTLRGLRAGDPCDTAERVGQAHGAVWVRCVIVEHQPGSVDVRVRVPIGGVFSWLQEVEATSRAGSPEVLKNL
ncbi:Rv3654c family TadE-like protein [Rothia sp. P6271]|uniref:Rv3654c family TadE-like protein n=2 Tax=unclassified Rothia (in: high G+C Gram-positive bacteria) TaxID=2689056 RepID=UPI003ACD94A2